MVYKNQGALIRPIEWRRVTNKVEIETILLQRNKRYLQQMASGPSPPNKECFQKVTENFGVSLLADKLLEGKITNELDSFPPTVRAWLLQFKHSDK